MSKFVRSVFAAASIAGLACSANSAPLDSLAGPHNFKLQGVTSEYSPAGVARGSESTFGIGEITEIRKTNGDADWKAGDGGDYLYYMLYGIADLSFTPGAPGTTNIYNIGCTGGPCDGKIHLDVYRMSSSISGILLKDPDDRLSFSTFNGLTNAAGASLYLGLEFVAGKVTDDTGTLVNEALATLFQNANTNALPASGTGTFFADAVSGSAKTKWDTNGFTTNTGAATDFDGNFTLKPNFVSTGGACPDVAAANTCFLGLINDPVQGSAVPEPGSLALAGLALAGLASVTRRSRK